MLSPCPTRRCEWCGGHGVTYFRDEEECLACRGAGEITPAASTMFAHEVFDLVEGRGRDRVPARWVGLALGATDAEPPPPRLVPAGRGV